MKRHETLHLNSPKPRRSSQARSYRRPSNANRTAPNVVHTSATGSSNSAHSNIDSSDQPLAPKSPLSDHTDTSSGGTADYFAPFVADPASHDLGTQLGDLGDLDPQLMSTTNWLPPAQPGQASFDPFNVLWHSDQSWHVNQPPAMIGEPMPSPDQVVVPSNTNINFSNTNVMMPRPIITQLKRVPSADVVACDSPLSISSVESSEHGTQAPSGEFYVDGGATRLPKGRKRRTSVHSTQGVSPGYGSHKSRLTMAINNLGNHYDHPAFFVNGFAYNTMFEVFNQTCTRTQTSFPPFEEEDFLPQIVIDDLVSLAVEHFLPTLPFIHKPKLRSQSCSWILYLALATIGTHYELNILDERVFSMNEFLRRALAWVEVSLL